MGNFLERRTYFVAGLLLMVGIVTGVFVSPESMGVMAGSVLFGICFFVVWGALLGAIRFGCTQLQQTCQSAVRRSALGTLFLIGAVFLWRGGLWTSWSGMLFAASILLIDLWFTWWPRSREQSMEHQTVLRYGKM